MLSVTIKFVVLSLIILDIIMLNIVAPFGQLFAVFLQLNLQ